MSYNNNYNQGYGQQNPYGNSGNPYGQAGNPYQQSNPYEQGGNNYSQGGYSGQTQQYGQAQGNPYNSRPGVQQQSSSQYDEERTQGGYGEFDEEKVGADDLTKPEMSNMNNRGNDPNRILNEIRTIDREIDENESEIERLRGLQHRFLADPNTSPESPLAKEINAVSENVMTNFRGLVARVKNIKQNPESGNPRNAPQVGKVDRRLKGAMNKLQQADRDYRQNSEEQAAREYRIVRPDASDAEVREAVQASANTQIFSQALISSDRRGEVQSVARRVQARHLAIQKIEQDMIALAQLFNDLEAMVVQQEAPVMAIEQKGEEVVDNTQKANVELVGAVDKARAARKKKWICLGIVLAIIIIIVVVVVVVVEVLKKRP